MKAGDLSVRERLVRLLEEGNPESSIEPDDGMSLIRSGRIDSLGLYNLALWVEEEVRSSLDMTTLDPSKEWDTIPDILEYIEKHRR